MNVKFAFNSGYVRLLLYVYRFVGIKMTNYDKEMGRITYSYHTERNN